MVGKFQFSTSCVVSSIYVRLLCMYEKYWKYNSLPQFRLWRRAERFVVEDYREYSLFSLCCELIAQGSRKFKVNLKKNFKINCNLERQTNNKIILSSPQRLFDRPRLTAVLVALCNLCHCVHRYYSARYLDCRTHLRVPIRSKRGLTLSEP